MSDLPDGFAYCTENGISFIKISSGVRIIKWTGTTYDFCVDITLADWKEIKEIM